jgi:hypothetical protein
LHSQDAHGIIEFLNRNTRSRWATRCTYPLAQRALLLTADLLFFRAPMAEVVRTKIMEKTGLQRRQIRTLAEESSKSSWFAGMETVLGVRCVAWPRASCSQSTDL